MSDADTVFAIAAAMEAAVGHAKSRRDLASILWAATEAVGDDAPAAAAKLAAAADYVAGGGNLSARLGVGAKSRDATSPWVGHVNGRYILHALYHSGTLNRSIPLMD